MKETAEYCAIVLKKVGFLGFILIFATAIFLIWGSANQKREFIDLYILQKNDGLHCVITITYLIFALGIISGFSKFMLSGQKKENNRIGKEKTYWQSKQLDRELYSTDKDYDKE